MKRSAIFLSLVMLLGSFAMSAQTPQSVLDKCLAGFKKGAVSAVYTFSNSHGASSGSIVLSGKKFRVLSSDLKSWYDGSTMWSYSKAVGEVNITTPTAADLAMANPYAIAQNYKTAYNMSRGTAAAGSYTIKFTPKKKSNIKEVMLTINTKTYYITKVQFVMTNNTKSTITVSNYKSGVKADAATFKFSKSQVPKGTPVVDLR